MIRVMFVCHGNICRSPMAEFVLKHLAAETGISDRLLVASSATSAEEICNGVGKPMYPPAKAELEKRGIPAEGKTAVQLKASDYEKYDLFVGMDNANIRNMHRILGGDPADKIRMLMSFTSRGGEVSDPWYTDRFDICYRDIYEGCKGLLAAVFGV